MVLGKPALVLRSTADSVLSHSSIASLIDFLVPAKKDGKGTAPADGGRHARGEGRSRAR